MPHKGYKQPPDVVERRIAPLRGRKRGPISEAQRAKQSRAMSGRTLTPEHRAQVVQTLDPQARLGDTWEWPEEVKERIGVSGTGKHDTPHAILGACVYCGAPATTYDHVIPRGRWGWDSFGNTVPACLPCNASKGHRDPEEWALSLEAGLEAAKRTIELLERRLAGIRSVLED